ncbi:phosphoenolpyruvate--protein phosphotransferase [Actinocorallia sp. A-T 12471]|uniref:phosphoenolpyruvate--protein phosphotransferase n=1 Tax=Actinocorallia sp. A-T 12471 TaxID=3089813 RepID=UPI0029D1C81C|nr:phosphoenolpyruvate--protein phosphotransferase [Actinocorallia sp. A-T 12471]MDX6744569.1 phosphoenolpyruvate--protein phosphotransferase [Actinocorallia sp. A-T 12471]
MREFTGTGVSPGVGVGRVRVMTGTVPVPPAEPFTGDRVAETARALAALEDVARELESRAAAAGGETHDVLAAQALMARDPDLAGEVTVGVSAGLSAARAVYESFGFYRELLGGSGAYISARVADLDDVRDRTVARLMAFAVPGVPDADDEHYVLITQDLAPADLALLDPERCVAFVTEEGGPIGHTAILARAMGIPAIVACAGALEVPDGAYVLADGASGTLVLDPDPARIERARAAEKARAEAVGSAAGPGRTKDGWSVPLLANVGGPKDIQPALDNGAEGVGLFRSEYLFLDEAVPPSEEQQIAAYRAVLEAFPRVVVRVLDAGADKPLSFLPPAAVEPNPALGERGLRLLRRHPDVLRGQLRALAKAAEGLPADRLRVMAPMVTDAEEARVFTRACREAGIQQAGIMIEVPAAAVRAHDIAEEVDFFSLGTNDLAQYVFAVDRQVSSLTRLQNPWRPALLDLMAHAAKAATEAGKGCGVCGEAAADPVMACVLAGLGVTSLSMSSPSLPLVRAALAAHTYAECQEAARAARAARTAGAARAAARSALPALETLGL